MSGGYYTYGGGFLSQAFGQTLGGQQAQMGMGPYESSGSYYSGQPLGYYGPMLSSSSSSPGAVIAKTTYGEPSLDDGLLAYLRARKKAWLEGVKVK